MTEVVRDKWRKKHAFALCSASGTIHAAVLPTLARMPGFLNRMTAMMPPRAGLKLFFCLLSAGAILRGMEVRVRLSLGQNSARPYSYSVVIQPGTADSLVHDFRPVNLQAGDSLAADIWTGRAGAGDIDSISFSVSYAGSSSDLKRTAHVMWTDLIVHSDADTARRLLQDPAFLLNPALMTVWFDKDQTRGFTFSPDRLLQDDAIWIPSFDAFLTLEDRPVSFAEYRSKLAPWHDKRILERIAQAPEANYQQFASLWEDMGSPFYVHPHQVAPGHIVCLSWDSAIPKFGIDRGAGVWNDYGNPDHFRFWFGFGDLTQGITRTWKSQSLQDGLPVITTVFEDAGIRYEVEQFAYPLNGPPNERKGDIPMVLLQKVRITNLGDAPRRVPIAMTHVRQLPNESGEPVSLVAFPNNAALFRENAHHRILMSIEGADSHVEWHPTLDYGHAEQRFSKSIRLDSTVFEKLPAKGSREFIVKLPSPLLDADSAETLEKLDYSQARDATLKFWSSWLDRGAQFNVPEKTVNDLYHASLWHALRLPRRHGGGGPGVQIELPYSNFAYDQTGIPWPGVQSVYVDYMLYELRGYGKVALEELMDQFRLNQDINGHVGGFANWMMYTPSMLYSVAQYYLLSGDRQGLDQLMPFALKALDWCLNECKTAQSRTGFEKGLVEGPLNDGTGDGVWALNQAYMYAGLQRFGTVLEALGNPRGGEALESARQLQQAVQRGFGHAAALSPIVQLRDHTWQPYVPSEALTPRRLIDLWYPTDVDVGPMHLLRLKVLPAESELGQYLLNDHEDNLFLEGLGMMNEPVYRPQAKAYLYLDNPKAVIRAFYSQMACAFSHTVFEPVEHRWMHGQYFGPPSTDGSWFELYRDMLLREADDRTLFIAEATPRKWLEDGKQIEVSRAPTYFGDVSFRIESHSAAGEIKASVDVPHRNPPDILLLRLRHPEAREMRRVTVNGKPWRDIDRQKELVRIEKPSAGRYEITVQY